MNVNAIGVLVVLQIFTQINAFSFNLKSVGTKQVTVTPGDVITYNAHITLSHTSPLSFHISLPYFETPIFSIISVDVLGVGANLQYASKPTYSKSKFQATNKLLRSQLSLTFPGSVTRSSSPSGAAFADDIVIQVKSRVLKHNNVTSGAVFWMYFGMEYQNESVWVLGKSVKADLQPAAAKIAAKVYLNKYHVPTTGGGLEFVVKIYHLLDSKSSATDVKVVLSVPSYLTYVSSSGNQAWPKFTATTDGNTLLTLALTESLEAGVTLQIVVKMDISVTDKGQFVHGHIYGDLEYKTNNEDNCEQTVKHKHNVDKSFKAYSHKDECDSFLTLQPANLRASSAIHPNRSAIAALKFPGFKELGWQPWGVAANSTKHLVDDFLQVNFDKKTTVTRLLLAGTYAKEQFVKSFLVSYSQDGVFWKYVLHFGKPKEFEGNTDSANLVTTLLRPEIKARNLRIHVKKYSTNGPSMFIRLYGCTDDTDVPSYTAHQRSFLVTTNMLILCNVYPDRTKAKTNCYSSTDNGLQWDAMDPRVVNVLGYDPGTSIIYGFGVTSSDTPVYMKLDPTLGLRLIAEADWDSVKGGTSMILITEIPMTPVNGNPLYQLPLTSVTLGQDTYVATPEGILKGTQMIASWADYKTY